MSDYRYQGSELEIFQNAVRWKAYFASRIRPHVRGDVLEVGAGIGATTRLLCDGRQSSWVCMEPDGRLAEQMRASFEARPLPVSVSIVVGALADVSAADRYDAILYIDVLEHIEDDREEVRRAAERLKPGGTLIVLAPAHQWLFTPFDRAVGHHRRYSAASLAQIVPGSLRREELIYLDSAGVLASLANRFLLKSGRASLSQVRLWESVLVRASRLLDPLFGYRLGKSLLGVWRKEEGIRPDLEIRPAVTSPA